MSISTRQLEPIGTLTEMVPRLVRFGCWEVPMTLVLVPS